MIKKLVPDRILDNVYQLTPSYLKSFGKNAVIFDIDNTLIAHDKRQPDQKLIDYLQSLKDTGIEICLVSNNQKERVEEFNRQLGLFAVPKAGKPKRRALLPCLDYLHTAPENILFVGDQILTDVWCAKKNKISCFLVKPIKPYENKFFYLKRWLEKSVLKAYYKQEKR